MGVLAKCQARFRVDQGMTTQTKPPTKPPFKMTEEQGDAFVEYVVRRLAQHPPGTQLVIVDLIADFARLHGVETLKAGKLRPIH